MLVSVARALEARGRGAGEADRGAVEWLVGVLARARREDAGLRGRDAWGGVEEGVREAGRAFEVGLPPVREIDAFWLGEAYQRLLAMRSGARRRAGAFYTPRGVVAHLVERALVGAERPPRRVLDPACGCGAFLAGVGRGMLRRWPELGRAGVGASLHGTDIDGSAAALCRLALWLEFGEAVEGPGGFERRVRAADALAAPPEAGSFDLVLGNPPFLSQLSARTAITGERRRELRERFGGSVRAYTDPAALFLQLAVEATRPGGAVGMVAPVSVLASRDAAEVRRRVASGARLEALWLDTENAFAASVTTVAVSLRRGAAWGGRVELLAGCGFASKGEAGAPGADGASWGELAAAVAGVPRTPEASGGTIGEMCEVTAGFRDEYYAVAAALEEGAAGDEEAVDRAPVVTTAMIDPAWIGWGEGLVRIAGGRWRRPVVRLAGEDAALRKVGEGAGRAKLVVATQTRVLEVGADPGGRFVPLTPLITVAPRRSEQLWAVAAALSSPVATAWVAARAFGTARSLGAIKPSAALLREMPVWGGVEAYTGAGECFRRAAEAESEMERRRWLVESAEEACRAAGCGDGETRGLMEWWVSRLPAKRRAAASAGREA